jgi:TolB-like protein
MSIWSAEIKELEKLYESFKGQLPDLEKELEQLIRTEDANVIMLYSRRCLEVIITDLCECQLKRERGTEPLKGIIDKLNKEKKVPSYIITSMHGLNDLSTYGTHPKDFDPEQVKPVLSNLDIIIKWDLKYKGIGTDIRTKPVEEIRQEIKSTETAKKSFLVPKKSLFSLVSGLLLIIAIAIAIFSLTREPEKSMAVLPFRNDSPDTTNTYFINGLMEEVLNNLMKISDFRILSRTSTEQYKGTNRPTMSEIAKKLGVSYIIEGSGQKYGNKFRLRVQLIKATGKEKHLWANSYEQELRETTDYFGIQSQIAQTIAKELKATITPEEKQLIEKIPTANLKALDIYQMGREEEKFTFYDLIISSSILEGIKLSPKESVERAEKMYKTALKYDSTFAPAYAGLAGTYWSKNYFKEFFSEHFMDSALILAERALSFDDQLPDAYFIRGMYYAANDSISQALKEFAKTLKFNPNYWLAYFAKGEYAGDPVMSIKNYQWAASRHHGPGLSEIYNSISFVLSIYGFKELAKNYSLKAVELESDSTKYYFWLYMYEFDYKNSFSFFEKKYSNDSTNLNALEYLSAYYSYTGQFKEALKFQIKKLERLKVEGRTTINEMQRVGYVYSKNGLKDSAAYYFNKQIDYCNNAIKSKRGYGIFIAYYDLAGIYAFSGDKIKAYENLKIFNKDPDPGWIRRFIKYDPLFDSIRNEPEFQNIVKDMDTKYLAEHERVKKWLEEQGML